MRSLPLEGVHWVDIGGNMSPTANFTISASNYSDDLGFTLDSVRIEQLEDDEHGKQQLEALVTGGVGAMPAVDE